MAKVYATGKRKTAVAKVWLKPGSGKILVNGLDLNTWLGGHEAIKLKVVQPLLLTKQGFCRCDRNDSRRRILCSG